jgi:hypothetical protein
MALGGPQLIHAATGTTPWELQETQPLMSRPAGGASQSAAEATLGLVTVDILGLAGTGVPTSEPINILARRMFGATIGEFWATGDSFCVLGALAVKAGNVPVALASVTWQQTVPTTGPVTPFTSAGGGLGEWWSYQFLAWPSGTRLTITATPAEAATQIFCTFSLVQGTGALGPAGPRATGAGTRYIVDAPSGVGTTLDFGWAAGLTLEPTPDPGQYNEDYGYPTGYLSFASTRDTIGASGWTGQSAPAWTMTAIAVTTPGG